MKLSIIIVNWNAKELLRKCLASLYHFTEGVEFEVLVVDNASHDGSPEMVASEFPSVILIRNSDNRGFGPANNEGIERARGEYLLFLNQDTELIENSFPTLLNKMDNDTRIGLLGPKLLNSDGSVQPSCRTFPTLVSQILILLKAHNAFPRIGPVKRYYMLDCDYASEREVDQLMGAAMLTRREVIDRVGNFDENFFFWFEEVDFCYRVKQAGWSIVFTPATAVIHHKGESQKALPARQKRFNRSLRLYFKKHKPYAEYLILLAFTPLSLLLSYALALVLRLRLPFHFLKKKKYL
jgi:GT2 family glycosyltransferase